MAVPYSLRVSTTKLHKLPSSRVRVRIKTHKMSPNRVRVRIRIGVRNDWG